MRGASKVKPSANFFSPRELLDMSESDVCLHFSGGFGPDKKKKMVQTFLKLIIDAAKREPPGHNPFSAA